ncbi:hypothetical protein Q9233_002557 [Columba guinea]|nr:hypothetical protein Q9233_002557 [Columba guinea]
MSQAYFWRGHMNRSYMIFPVLWLVDESAACLEPTESNMQEKYYIRINNVHKIVRPKLTRSTLSMQNSEDGCNMAFTRPLVSHVPLFQL